MPAKYPSVMTLFIIILVEFGRWLEQCQAKYAAPFLRTFALAMCAKFKPKVRFFQSSLTNRIVL